MSSLGNIAGSLSEGFQNARDKLKQVAEVLKKIPDILTYTVSGEKLEKLPKITSNNFRLYIGQIFNNGQGLYDEAFIIGAIKIYLDWLDEGEKLIIESSSIISWLVNGLREKDGALSSEEQVKYLEKIIKEYFPKQKDKIEINRLENNHTLLISKIKNEGLKGLESEEDIELDNGNNSSDIARILYKVSQNNSKFFSRLVSTIGKKKRKGERYDKHNIKSYYALVELAIRISDYLNGVNIHGGESRQRLYDQIIFDILNGGFDDVEELRKLKEYCLINGNESFSSLNFNKDKYKKELERKKHLKQLSRKTVLFTAATSLLTSSILAGYKWKEYEIETETRQRVESILLEKAKTTGNFRDTTDNWMWQVPEFNYDTPEKKIKLINYYSEIVAKMFFDRFYDGQDIDIKVIEIMIATELNRSDFLQNHSNFGIGDWYNKLLFEYFIPENGAVLTQMGFNINSRLGKFEKYRQAFENTSKLSYNDGKKIHIDMPFIKYIGTITVAGGIEYKIGIAKCGDVYPMIGGNYCDSSIANDKEFLVASTDNGGYSIYLGQIVTRELL